MSRRPQRAMLSGRMPGLGRWESATSWLWRLAGSSCRSCRLSTPTVQARIADRRGGTTSVESYRGAIFDRHGVALAVARPSVQLSLDLRAAVARLAVQGAEARNLPRGPAPRRLGLEADGKAIDE